MTLRLDYDPYDPLPMLDSDDVGRYLDVEAEYMAAKGYARNRDAEKHRQRAVLLISKYSDYENFDPVIPYLAMNYFDRYISKKPILELSRDRLHDADIIALSCLTIAWKMRDLKFKTRTFLAERPDLAEVLPLELARTEIQILEGLEWRTRSLMAFCYLPYLEPKFISTYGFSRRTLNQIIIQIQDGIGITHYRPSVIAASALLTASRYLYPDRYNSFFRRITSDPIFQRYLNHIELCVNGMIIMCNSLRLIIESALPEEETSQIRRVRAGQNPEGESTSSTRVTNMSSMEEYNGDSKFGFRLRWSVIDSNINKDDFVIFKDLPEAVAEEEAEPVPATETQPQPQPTPVAPQDEVGPADSTLSCNECCNLL